MGGHKTISTTSHLQTEKPQPQWISPTSNINIGASWSLPTRAYDGLVTTYSTSPIPHGVWSGYLQLLLPQQYTCSKVRIFTDVATQVSVNLMQLYVYYDGVYNIIFNGPPTEGVWIEHVIPAGNKMVTKAQFRYYNGSGIVTQNACVSEFEFWQIP